jgi:hypothetical protein
MKKFLILAVLVSALIFASLQFLKNKEEATRKAESLASLPTVGQIRKTPEEIKFLNGNILEISKDSIIVSVPSAPNPYEEWPLTRTIQVGENTKILKRTVKSPKVYEAEKTAFTKNPVGEYPLAYSEKEIEITDLQVGMGVVIESDINIKFLDSIEPTIIRAL